MADLRFRPRFRFRTPMHPDEIRDRLRGAVRERNPAGFRLRGNLPHMVLQYPAEARRLWTPQMDIDLEMDQEPGQETFTVVRCLIGPAPHVWMMFMGGYIALAFLAVIGLSIGYPQLRLQQWPWGLYGGAVLLAAALALWLLAQAGKRQAREEMLAMKRFLDAALGCDCLAAAEAERHR
ncbi:MAG: hypothetical protein ACK4L7_02030 [Flavobacteriales bacterium]